MNNFFRLSFAGALLFGLVCCSSQSESKGDSRSESEELQDESASFPREETLYIAGWQWDTPNTFNPLYEPPTWPSGSGQNLTYEPLIVFNTLTGKVDPLLATLKESTNEYISLIMNPEARWSDNKPLTADDVVYTYELGKRFEAAPIAYVWDFISGITVEKIPANAAGKEGAQVEKITFHVNQEKENNPLAVLDILKLFQIVPRHIIEARLKEFNGDFSEFLKDNMDKNPVVSGPYNLLTYSNEKIVLKRRNDYWGNKSLYHNRKPQPKYIIHPIYKSNDHFSIGMQKGELDVQSNFIPRIWMKARSGVGTWYSKEPYFVPASIPMFLINHMRYPLSDRNIRRAMAYAINYKSIRELAVSGYSPDLQPGLILPFGVEKKYFSAEDVQKYGARYDPGQAKKILADAGYTPVFVDGKLDYMKNAKGEKVPSMQIKSPAGWSDFESIVKIAVKDMRAAGIDVREGFVDAGLYWQCLPTGDFDLLLDTPEAQVVPSTPWSRFQNVMSSRDWKPVGEKMNENRGRYNNPNSKEYNPEVERLLRAIPRLTDQQEKINAYRALNVIFMQDQPTLPIVYRPEEFYEFSTKHWTNWPTEQNPYAPAQTPSFGAGRNILWELKPVK